MLGGGWLQSIAHLMLALARAACMLACVVLAACGDDDEAANGRDGDRERAQDATTGVSSGDASAERGRTTDSRADAGVREDAALPNGQTDAETPDSGGAPACDGVTATAEPAPV